MTYHYRIIHTNDTHSYVDKLAKRKHLFDSVKQTDDNVLFLDAGDNLTGSLFYTIFHGKYEPTFLNQLHYDALTLGNHEFDNGSKGVQQFVSALQSPVIASNLTLQSDDMLNQLPIYRTLVKTLRNGLKIGIFALITPTTKNTSSPSVQTIFEDVVETAKYCVRELKHTDSIVLLSHLGDDEDRCLAELVPEIDVIIGSHTHKKLEEPIVIWHEALQKETLIVQAGSYGQYVGDIAINIDNKKIKSWAYTLHDLNDYPYEDDTLKIEIDQLFQSVEHITNRVVAQTKEQLNGKRDITKTQSTNLTNLVTDAYYYKAMQLGFEPDIAIMNSGGIRQSISAGDITYGQVMQVLPFSCELFIFQATGKQLELALTNGEYPQIANGKLTIYNTNNKAKQAKVFIKQDNGQFDLVKHDKLYTVVTNSFIASGKDKYDSFIGVKNLVKSTYFDTDIILDYLMQLNSPFIYDKTNRLTIINKESD